MGTSRDPGALAGKFLTASTKIAAADLPMAKAGALAYKTALVEAGARHGPLHGRKGKAIRLSARYDVRGKSVIVRPVPAGAWQIAETGADAHLIGKTTGRGGRKGKTQFLKGDSYGHPVRGPVAHPGARGSHSWTRARDRAKPDVIKAMKQVPTKVINGVFG